MSVKYAGFKLARRLRPRRNRPGVVLITAIILIAAMMMVGTALILAATMDIRHSGMERQAHGTFFDADGMMNVTVGLLKVLLHNGSASDYLDNGGSVKVRINDRDFDLNHDKDRLKNPDQAALVFSDQSGNLLGWTDVVSYTQTWSNNSGAETDGGAAYKDLRVYVIRALGVSASGGPEVSRIVAFYQSYE